MEWTTKVAKNRCENNKNWTSDKEPLNKGLMCDGWWWQISVIMCPTTVSQSLYSHLLFPNICISSASITSVKSEKAILYSFIIAAATVVNSLTNKQKTVNYSCWDFFKKLNLSSFILPGLQHIGEFSCLVPMICFMTHTHTHTRLTALFPGLPGWVGTRKVNPIWILLKQETVSVSGISWAICKSAPCSRQITTPATHHSVFYRPDALPATQPTVSKHWRDENHLPVGELNPGLPCDRRGYSPLY